MSYSVQQLQVLDLKQPKDRPQYQKYQRKGVDRKISFIIIGIYERLLEKGYV